MKSDDGAAPTGLTIRPESESDVSGITAVNEAAFGRPTEARLVVDIRKSSDFIPALSLVALLNGVVVGHCLLSTVRIEGNNGREWQVLALGPLAVLPELQRKGIGSALVRRSLTAAAALGYRLIVLLGHPTYYPRFGFEPGAKHGITQPFQAGDASMVYFLDPGARGEIEGVVRWSEPFRLVDA